MRFMVKVMWHVEKGNELARKGNLGKIAQSILEEIKPEAAYFVAEEGKRSAILFVNMDDASQIPAIAEPWILAVNATVEISAGNEDGGSSEGGGKYNIRLTTFTMIVWFVVTYLAIVFVRELDNIVIFGFPFGYYMGAQGSLIIFVWLIFNYSNKMNKADVDYGVQEEEE